MTTNLITETVETTVVIENDVVTVLTIGEQGPPGASGILTIAEANDVDVSNVQDGSILVYSDVEQKWLATKSADDLTIGTLNITAGAITATETDGDINLSPNGTGTVNVSDARISNVSTPVQDTDAATKSYVDNASPAFLIVSLTDFADENYYYYAGLIRSAWQINRYLKSNVTIKTSANVVNNPTVQTLENAWSSRGVLVYG